MLIVVAAAVFGMLVARSVAQRRFVASKAANQVVEALNEKEALLPKSIMEAHAAAVENNVDMYTDPITGLSVFTRVAHLRRGKCCGSHCRHCPYGHVNVPVERRLSAPIPTTQHKATVYTKTGDRGTSVLFTGERRSKADAAFEALGNVDELNSFVGVAIAEVRLTPKGVETIGDLEWIQRRLLDVGSVVATPGKSVELDIDASGWTERIERRIDEMDAALPPLDQFILPGGGKAAASLHVCRSVCRRAERSLVTLKESDKEVHTKRFIDVLRFLNRSSDYFFIAARYVADSETVRKSDPDSR